uniref:NAC transcription factor n=1 Tax=Solanum tuberosum TaxID=4113 RepID=M1DXH7_SOLTU
MSKQMGICFHPTDTELINYLKRFFKGELSLNQQCPIQFADIYGDQPPWEIFGANFEEKFRCFITPLKKLKTEYKRFSRICAKGTWKGQTGEHLTRRNRTAPVVGFKRNLKFETSECGQKNTWLMVEYHVADSFFKENNHILKEDFVVCRIKKKKMGKEKNVDHVMRHKLEMLRELLILCCLNLIIIKTTPQGKIKLGFVMNKMQLRLQLRNMMFKTVLMKLLQWRRERQRWK